MKTLSSLFWNKQIIQSNSILFFINITSYLFGHQSNPCRLSCGSWGSWSKLVGHSKTDNRLWGRRSWLDDYWDWLRLYNFHRLCFYDGFSSLRGSPGTLSAWTLSPWALSSSGRSAAAARSSTAFGATSLELFNRLELSEITVAQVTTDNEMWKWHVKLYIQLITSWGNTWEM